MIDKGEKIVMFINPDIYKNPQFDLNGDGKIDFYEYTKALEKIDENTKTEEDG